MLQVDNADVGRQQVEQLERLRAERHRGEVGNALPAVGEAARYPSRTLIDEAVDASEALYTVAGEVSWAIAWHTEVVHRVKVDGNDNVG